MAARETRRPRDAQVQGAVEFRDRATPVHQTLQRTVDKRRLGTERDNHAQAVLLQTRRTRPTRSSEQMPDEAPVAKLGGDVEDAVEYGIAAKLASVGESVEASMVISFSGY